MINLKETFVNAADTVDKSLNAVANEINENPYLIYCGLIGLSFAVGLFHGDVKKDLREIKDKLD